MSLVDQIRTKIVDLDEPAVKALVEQALSQNERPMAILEALREALAEVGRLYEERTYFLSDLLLAGGISQLVLDALTPRLKGASEERKGKVVIGTVEGSFHGMGKSIVVALLLANGYQVYDLGVNVPPERFVEKVKETDASALALSVGLVQALPSVAKVVASLKQAGMRDRVKVILGGNAANAERAAELGCDAYAPTAVAGMQIIDDWTKKAD